MGELLGDSDRWSPLLVVGNSALGVRDAVERWWGMLWRCVRHTVVEMNSCCYLHTSPS